MLLAAAIAGVALSGLGAELPSDRTLRAVLGSAPKRIEPVTPKPYDGSTRQQRRAMARLAKKGRAS
jgi:hypothetical protein